MGKKSEVMHTRINDFFRACGGFPSEFDSGVLHDLNEDFIKALDAEHPGKVVLIRTSDWDGNNITVREYHQGEKIYNFSADFVMPSDTPEYATFRDVLTAFDRKRKEKTGGESGDWSRMCELARAAGGDVLLWS